MPPLVIAGAIAAAGAVTGAVISKSGSDRQADALEASGNAQADAARAETREATKRLEKEIAERRRIEERATAAATRSPNEIAAVDRMIDLRKQAYNSQMAQIDKEYKLLEAADPAIKEAGQQLLGLMRGENTKLLDPVVKNRQLQRQKLEAQLSRTLGPGFRTTSAGIQALTRFDESTDMVFAQTQDQAINRAFSVYQGGMQTRSGALADVGNIYNQLNGMDQNILTAESGIKARETNAVLGSAATAPINFGAIQDARRSETATAGNRFAGQAASGQATQQLGGTLMGVGTSFVSQILGNQLQTSMYKDIMGSSTPGSSLTVGGGSTPTSYQIANQPPLTYNSAFGTM